MKTDLRYRQLRGISFDDRTDLTAQIQKINNDLLKNNENLKLAIADFIESKIKSSDFSINFLADLRYKLSKVNWLILPKDEWLYQVLYACLVKTILLPSYTQDRQKQDILTELSQLYEQSIQTLDKKLDKMQKESFHINIWDISELEFELNSNFWLNPREIKAGWALGTINIGTNLSDDTYVVDIPVRVSSRIKVWDNNISKPSILQRDIENLLKWISINNKIKWEYNIEWFNDFTIKTRRIKNSDLIYSEDKEDDLFVLSIEHNDLRDLDLSLWTEKVISTLKWFLDLTNFLTKKIIELDTSPREIKLFNFSIWEMALWKDIPWQETVSKETLDKFSRLLLKDNSKTTLWDVWWQKEAKEEILKIITWIKYEEIMRSWWAKNTSWIIFEWPPWTWKTLLAKVIANEVDAVIYNIKLTDIQTSAYINEWANNLKELFKFLRFQANKSKKKIVIILDELDALFKKRNNWNQSPEDTKIVNTFLSEMSWMEDLKNIIFIWTTNNLDQIDDAVLRSWRMTTKVKVSLPDFESRKQIFSIHINKVSNISNKAKSLFTNIDLDFLSSQTNWFSWADIEEIIRCILEKKAMEEINSKTISADITKEDILEIIKKIKSHKKSWNNIWFLG